MTKDFCVCSVRKTRQPDLSCCFHLVKQYFLASGLTWEAIPVRSLLERYANGLQFLRVVSSGVLLFKWPHSHGRGRGLSCDGHCTTLPLLNALDHIHISLECCNKSTLFCCHRGLKRQPGHYKGKLWVLVYKSLWWWCGGVPWFVLLESIFLDCTSWKNL